MEYLPFQLSWLITGAFVTLLSFVVLLNIFGLPANWILLGLTVLWKMAHVSAAALDTWFWVMLIGLALLGEALELGVQVLNARRHGSSSSGTFAAILGAIAGAILLAPLFFGLGALIGALVGAWIGCFVTEFLIRGMPFKNALDSAIGAMMGRFLGTLCKCGAGGCMVALTAGRIWQNRPSQPDAMDAPAQVLYILQNIC